MFFIRRDVLIPILGEIGGVVAPVVGVGKVWVSVIRPGYVSGVCSGVVDHRHFSSGEFHQELARAAHAAIAESTACRSAQLEVSFSAGDPDKEQAAFFFELGRIVLASDVGQDVLFDGGEIDVIEFEAFCRVEGHEGDTVLVGDVVGIAREADLFEELLEASTLAQQRVFVLSVREQFADIFLDALVGSFGFFPGEVFDVVGRFEKVGKHCDDRLSREVYEFFVDREEFAGARLGLFAQESVVDGCPQGDEHRDIARASQFGDLAEGFIPESSWGEVDDPFEGDIVFGVVDQSQVGDEVTDFLPLVESESADELVGDTASHQGLFEETRVCVGAVEDCKIFGFGGLFDQMFGDLIGDVFGFIFGRCVGAQADLGAIRAGRDEHLGLAVDIASDQLVGEREDLWRAAIVFLEPHDGQFGVIPFEVQDVSDIGPAPSVDGLVRISGDVDIGVIERQAPNDHVLSQVGVLVFVDEHVTVFGVKIGAKVLVGSEDRRGVHEQIVEVDGVVSEQILLVDRIDFADGDFDGVSGLLLEHFRDDRSVFEVADSFGDVGELQVGQ